MLSYFRVAKSIYDSGSGKGRARVRKLETVVVVIIIVVINNIIIISPFLFCFIKPSLSQPTNFNLSF